MGHEQVYKPFSDFLHKVMGRTSPFTPAERELIAAYTSNLNDCDFCYDAHKTAGSALMETMAVGQAHPDRT